MGDFNFPYVNWESGGTSRTTEENLSADRLLKFMSDQLINQFVSTPTHDSNVLDLFFTNNGNLVTNVSCAETNLSDHNLVDVML